MQAFEKKGKHHLSVRHVLLRFLTSPFVFLVGRLYQNIVRLKSLSAFHFSFLHVLKRFAGLKIYALLLVFGGVSFDVQGQGFSGSYAPGNWTTTQVSSGNGSVNSTGAPTNIIFTGPTTGGSTTRYERTMPASGTVSFSWSTTHGDPGYATFGYYLNGTYTAITTGASSGSTSVPVNSGDVFAFYGSSNYSNFGTFVATITSFTGPISCTAPTTQATIGSYTSTGNTSTTVNWSRGNGTSGVIVVGRCTSAALSNPNGGTTYTANSAFGFGSKTGSGNFVVYSGTGTSATVTGLNPGTSYTFTVYEYNTTSTCYKTPGASSAVSTTGTALSYPAVSGGGCTYNAISGVTINSVVISSGLTCAGNYVDNTCTGYTETLTAGSTYTFSVAGSPYLSPSFSNLGFYLDANDNGTFETGEFIGNFTASASPWTGSITIPSGTASGAHRLRIQAKWSSNGSTYSGSLGPYGQAQDYMSIVQGVCTAPNGTVSFQAFSSVASTTTTTNATYSNGGNTATGYVVLRNTTNTAPTAPASGTAVPTAGNSVTWGATYTVVNTSTTIGSSVAFASTGLTASTTYYYWVVAYQNTNGPCWFTPGTQASNSQMTSAGGVCTAPNGTVSFQAFSSVASTTTTTNATYSNGANTATGYIVLRNTTNTAPTAPASGTAVPTAGSTSFVSGYTVVGSSTTLGSSQVFNSTGLSASTTYYYWVVAYQNTNGPCWFTPTIQASNSQTTTAASCTAPNGTVSFGAFSAVTSSATTTNVTYTNGINTATGYALLRNSTNTAPTAPASGTAVPIAGNSVTWGATYTVVNTSTTIGSSVPFSNTSLTAGTNYYYWVVAYQNTNGPCWFTPGTQSSNLQATPAVPVVTLANNSAGQVASGTPAPSTNNLQLNRVQLTNSAAAAAVLTQVTCTTAGTYQAADISCLKLWYQTSSATLNTGTATLLSTIMSPGAAGTKIFSFGSNQTIPVSTTGYFFITTDVAGCASGSRTINVAALTTSNFTFSQVSISGTATAGGAQTFTGTTTDFYFGTTNNMCNGSGTGAFPFNVGGSIWKYNESGAIYLKSELPSCMGSGTIDKIAFATTKICGGTASGVITGNVKIWMRNTSSSSYSGTVTYSTQRSAMVNVFDATVTNLAVGADGYLEFTGLSGFTWNGTSNIEVSIEFCNLTTFSIGGAITWASAPSVSNTAFADYSNTTCSASISAFVGGRTITRFSTTPCTLPSAAGTISGSSTVCQSQTGVSYSVPTISGATSYTWSYSGTGFTPSASTASITGTFSSSATSGNLTVTGVNTCGNGTVSATYAITVSANNTAGAASSTQTVVKNSTLTSITHTTTGATNIGTASGLPAGVSASWSSNVITISGTPTSAGTFTYSIPLTGGCGSVNATGTITVVDAYTWNGSTSSAWDAAANWTPSGVPTAPTNVNIPAVSLPNVAPVTSTLTIDANVTYTLQSNAKLTLSGIITNGGTLTIESGATLVQTGSGANANTGSGTYNVKQDVTGSGTTSPNGRFWYLGSPLSNGLSTALLSNNNLLWQWNEGAGGNPIGYATVSSGQTLTQGRSYVLRSGQNETLNFSGTGLSNGTVTVPDLTRSGTTHQFRGCHLVSNPYPSYLDWNTVTKTNVSTTMYVRTASVSSFDVLETYNSFNGQGTSNSGPAMTRYIAPMQGFWVKVETDGQTGSLAMDNSMRSHQPTGSGLRSTPEDFPAYLRFNMIDGLNKDQMILLMSPDASMSLDNFDSEKMSASGYAQFYSTVNAKKLVINGMKNVKAKTSVPLTLVMPTSKSYVFQAEEFNIEDGLILLEDKQEDVIQDLTINPTYSFFGNAGTNATRFVVHFQLASAPILVGGPQELESLGSEDLTTDNIQIVSNNQGTVIVRLDEGFKPEGNIRVFDASGRLLEEIDFNDQETTIHLNGQAGMYFVEVSAGKLMVKKKIVIE